MDPRARKQLVIAASTLAGLGLVALKLRGPAPQTGEDTATLASSATVPSASPQAPAAVAAPTRDPAALRQRFVGSATCTPCHAAQAAAYQRSHHADALVVPSSAEVRGKLDGTTFTTPLGGTTRFTKHDGALEVTSPDATGRVKTLPIAYAAGIFPLQQYVVATERGKLQTLGVTWDARPAQDGGERWFHVYGPRGIAHDDTLFFTAPAQNWNHVCADCHSTLVERRYDVSADSYDTRWAELSVGCEACHGPGAEHVKVAKAGTAGGAGAYTRALNVSLRPAVPWSPSPTGSPTPRAQDGVEVGVCAPCHSRREPLSEGFVAGDEFLDAFEPELLRPGRYHADGQVEGEVYEWGSFLQSKMYASGVRCSDCHEPHAAELRAPGNALCTRCHEPARFDAATHSHHAGATAPACVDCHMPSETFMQIDVRRDHSIRIPRPELSIDFGPPNACTSCHEKQTPRWALEQLQKWNPSWQRRAHFGDALGHDRKGMLDAPKALAALARDATAPAMARATALERLGHYPTPALAETLRAALASSDPLVVYGAVLGANALPPAQRAPLLAAVLGHPRRAIRVAAGKGVADIPLAQLSAEMRAAAERAFADVEASFAVQSSRPESHVERSVFELGRGKVAEAEAELKIALRLAPCFVEAHLNLADLSRARHDEATAEREIRAALACGPQSAAAHHALGLWLIRAAKKTEAVRSLRKAVELAPNDMRYSYVLAVAIAEAGDVEGAVKVLETALEKRPNDRDSLQALAAYLRRLDRKELASEADAKLAALLRN
jgi:predicted CXXCH cytochrome family protein